MKKNIFKPFKTRKEKSKEEDKTYMPLPANKTRTSLSFDFSKTARPVLTDNDGIYCSITGDVSADDTETAVKLRPINSNEYSHTSRKYSDSRYGAIEKKPQENVYGCAQKQQASAGQLAAGQRASKSASTTQTCVCVYKWTAQSDAHISLDVGEILTNVHMFTATWWFGTGRSGHSGIFPSVCVEISESSGSEMKDEFSTRVPEYDKGEECLYDLADYVMIPGAGGNAFKHQSTESIGEVHTNTSQLSQPHNTEDKSAEGLDVAEDDGVDDGDYGVGGDSSVLCMYKGKESLSGDNQSVEAGSNAFEGQSAASIDEVQLSSQLSQHQNTEDKSADGLDSTADDGVDEEFYVCMSEGNDSLSGDYQNVEGQHVGDKNSHYRPDETESQLLVDNRKEERHPTTGHYDYRCEYLLGSSNADRLTHRIEENTGVGQATNEENGTEPEYDRHDDDKDVYFRQSPIVYCSGGICVEKRQDVFKSTMVVQPTTVIQSPPAILPVSVPPPLPVSSLATPPVQTTNLSSEVKMATVLVMVKLISAERCVCVDVLVLMACNSQKLKDFMEPHVQKGYVTATTLECQLFRNKGNVRADVKDILWMKDMCTPGVVLESSVDNLWADAVLSSSFPVTSADAALSNGAFNSLFVCKISVQQDNQNLQTATITCDLQQYKTPGKTTFVNYRCDDCAGERSSEKFSKRRSKVTSRRPPSREVPVSTSSSGSRWSVSGHDSSGPFDFQSEYSSMSAATRDKLKLADSSSGPQCNVRAEVSPEHRSPVTWV